MLAMASRQACPALRRPGVAGPRQDVLPVEQEPGVDVPGHAVEPALDLVGVDDPGEEILARERGGAGDPVVERADRVERDELRDPGVAELEDVRHRVAGEGGQQLLVGGAPGDLLDPDRDAGMAPLELGGQLLHDLALAPHRPEVERDAPLALPVVAGEEQPETEQRAPPPRRATGEAHRQEAKKNTGSVCQIVAISATPDSSRPA